MSQIAPIAVLTRIGLGVFDPLWWKARLALFEAVTLPSLARFRDLDITWYILLDVDIDDEFYAQLHEAVDRVGADFVRFTFVENNAFAIPAALQALRSTVSPGAKMIVHRIDDDDAVAADFYHKAIEEFEKEPDRSQILTFPNITALNAPTFEIGSYHRRSLTFNTLFYGTSEEVINIVMKNHTRWLEIGAREGMLTREVLEPDWRGMYTWHQQGDGSYDRRVKLVDDWAPLTEANAHWFGLDVERLNQWSEIQAEVPATIGLTWRRTQVQNKGLSEHRNAMRALKQEIIETNSAIFDRETEFFYVMLPANNRAPKGKVRFKGAGTPGYKVLLYVAGESRNFKPWGSATTDPVTGDFEIASHFQPATWNILFEFKPNDGSEVVQSLESRITIK